MNHFRLYRLSTLSSFVCMGLASACGSMVEPAIGDVGTLTIGGNSGVGASGGTTSPGNNSADIGVATGGQTSDETISQQLMSRWNQAADSLLGTFTFHWSKFDQFPHPTYKGGSAEAYQSFAQVLLTFLQRGDDFDFLEHNSLIDLHLVYVFPSGQSGLDTSFRQLITDFSTGTTWANIPSATRNSLQQYADKLAGNTG